MLSRFYLLNIDSISFPSILLLWSKISPLETWAFAAVPSLAHLCGSTLSSLPTVVPFNVSNWDICKVYIWVCYTPASSPVSPLLRAPWYCPFVGPCPVPTSKTHSLIYWMACSFLNPLHGFIPLWLYTFIVVFLQYTFFFPKEKVFNDNSVIL